MTRHKGSTQGDDKTDATAGFNDHPELFGIETDEQFTPPLKRGSEQQISADSDQLEFDCADRTEANSDNHFSTILRRPSQAFKTIEAPRNNRIFNFRVPAMSDNSNPDE